MAARHRFGRHVHAATNIRVVFYTVPVVSKESLWVYPCSPLSLLSNASANTLPQQQKTFGGVVFYAVYVVSKESKQLVLPRTSYIL
jgi:hypothetical protein